MKINESATKLIRNILEQYKDSDEETLYSLIYSYYPREEGGGYNTNPNMGAGGDQSISNRISFGKRKFGSLEQSIYKKVCCEHKHEFDKINSENIGEMMGLTAIIITSFPAFTQVAVGAIVTLIVVEKGLPRFCKTCKSKYGACKS